jgi:hypothetical protein
MAFLIPFRVSVACKLAFEKNERVVDTAKIKIFFLENTVAGCLANI